MEKEKFNNHTHLYFIRDRLSKTAETAVIQAMNDAVAVRGFQAFLQADDKRREEANQPLIGRIERELVHICELDENNVPITYIQDEFIYNYTGYEHDVRSYRVVTTGDKVENYLEEVRNGLRGEEDGNI